MNSEMDKIIKCFGMLSGILPIYPFNEFSKMFANRFAFGSLCLAIFCAACSGEVECSKPSGCNANQVS